MTKAKNDFTLIKASRVIDGLGGPAIERGAVLVEGDQISKVAPEEEIVVPEGANVEEIVYENKLHSGNHQPQWPSRPGCQIL